MSWTMMAGAPSWVTPGRTMVTRPSRRTTATRVSWSTSASRMPPASLGLQSRRSEAEIWSSASGSPPPRPCPQCPAAPGGPPGGGGPRRAPRGGAELTGRTGARTPRGEIGAPDALPPRGRRPAPRPPAPPRPPALRHSPARGPSGKREGARHSSRPMQGHRYSGSSSSSGGERRGDRADRQERRLSHRTGTG